MPSPCHRCRGPIEVGCLPVGTQLTCPHCGVVNQVLDALPPIQVTLPIRTQTDVVIENFAKGFLLTLGGIAGVAAIGKTMQAITDS